MNESERESVIERAREGGAHPEASWSLWCILARDSCTLLAAQASGFRVQGSGFRVYRQGLRVLSLRFGLQGPGFRVEGFDFRVYGLGV